MPGLFSRIKTWASLETLSKTDLNAEFDNIITNFVPLQMDDYSSTVAEMQTQTDPGEDGTESQPTTMAGELARIRFLISEITGKTYWYESPPTTLSSGGVSALIYLPFTGGNLDEVYSDTIRRGANPMAEVAYDDWTDNSDSNISVSTGNVDFGTTNKKFGKYSFTCATDNIMCVGGNNSNSSKGSVSLHFRNFSASSGLFCNPSHQMNCYLDSFGKVVFDLQKSTAASATLKNTETVTGTTVASGSSSWQHINAPWVFNDADGDTTGSMAIYLDGTEEGTAVSGNDLDVTTVKESNWFFGCKLNNPDTWDVFYTASGLPDAAGWTLAGDGDSVSVSDGILNLLTNSTDKGVDYSRSDAVDLSQFTIEWKMKISSQSQSTAASSGPATPPFMLIVRDDSMDRSFRISMTPFGIVAYNSDSAAAAETRISKPVSTDEWHVYRVTTSGGTNPTLRLYIDGVIHGSLLLDRSDATASDVVQFGDTDNSDSGHNVDASIEWVRYYDGGALPPVAEATAGDIDDVMVAKQPITSSTIITSLGSNAASSVFNKLERYSLNPAPLQAVKSYATLPFNSSSVTWVKVDYTNAFLYSDGITPQNVFITFRMSAGAVPNNVQFVVADNEQGKFIDGADPVEMHLPTTIVDFHSTSVFHQATFQFSKVFSAGVHKLDLYARSAETASFNVFTTTIGVIVSNGAG